MVEKTVRAFYSTIAVVCCIECSIYLHCRLIVKSAKDRMVSLLLTVNATRTDKIKPLVIRKSFRPRGFPQNLLSDFPVDYESNCKAWMTGEGWTRYLKKWERAEAFRKKNPIFVWQCTRASKSEWCAHRYHINILTKEYHFGSPTMWYWHNTLL